MKIGDWVIAHDPDWDSGPVRAQITDIAESHPHNHTITVSTSEGYVMHLAPQHLRPSPIREHLAEITDDEELLFCDGLDGAIVGVAQRCGKPNVVVYSYEAAVRIFVEDGLSHEEAVEHMEHNVVGAWVGERTPLFMTYPERW